MFLTFASVCVNCLRWSRDRSLSSEFVLVYPFEILLVLYFSLEAKGDWSSTAKYCTLCDDENSCCITQECGAPNPIDIFCSFPVRRRQRPSLEFFSAKSLPLFCNKALYTPEWFWEIDPPSSGAGALGTKIEVPTWDHKELQRLCNGVGGQFSVWRVASELRQERPSADPLPSPLRFSSTQYVVLHNFEVTTVMAISLWTYVALSFAGSDYRGHIDRKMQGKYLYVLYQSSVIK